MKRHFILAVLVFHGLSFLDVRAAEFAHEATAGFLPHFNITPKTVAYQDALKGLNLNFEMRMNGERPCFEFPIALEHPFNPQGEYLNTPEMALPFAAQLEKSGKVTVEEIGRVVELKAKYRSETGLEAPEKEELKGLIDIISEDWHIAKYSIRADVARLTNASLPDQVLSDEDFADKLTQLQYAKKNYGPYLDREGRSDLNLTIQALIARFVTHTAEAMLDSSGKAGDVGVPSAVLAQPFQHGGVPQLKPASGRGGVEALRVRIGFNPLYLYEYLEDLAGSEEKAQVAKDELLKLASVPHFHIKDPKIISQLQEAGFLDDQGAIYPDILPFILKEHGLDSPGSI